MTEPHGIVPSPSWAADDALIGLTALGPVPHERKARDWALVLQSTSLWHAIRRMDAGWVVLVRDTDYAAASAAIHGYEVENRDWPPPRARERARHASSSFIPVALAGLLAFFLVTGPVAGGSRWFERGTAVTALVLSSQPWRAVTALTLHADTVHVLGNVISGSVFGAAVQRRLGPGGALLAILVSGFLGNVGNAFWHQAMGQSEHASIGASTAVFGAVGLLAATQLVLDRPERKAERSWLELAAPLVGGLALLGTLGASPESDVGAHLFGFVSGALLGLAVAFPLRHRTLHFAHDGRYAHHVVQLGKGTPLTWIQVLLGALALGVVGGSWALALPRPLH